MASFRDDKSQDWVLNITVLDVKMLREGEPSIRLTDSESLGTLFDDDTLLYVAVWQLVKAQAKEREIDEVDFAKIFTAKYIDASKAFLEALQNFFLQTGRPELKELILKILSASTRLRSIVEKNLRSDKFGKVVDKLVMDEDQRLERNLDKLLNEQTPTNSSGSTPAS